MVLLPPPRLLCHVIALSAAALTSEAFAQSDGPAVGLIDLADRIGAENLPTGANVIVGQVEAFEGANYQPNEEAGQFAGKTFINESGPSGISNHATTVGRDFYGLTQSIAPGIPTIHVFSASDWAQDGYLRANFSASTPPALPPAGLRIFNNSWIASFNSMAVDQAALRRADFAVNRDQVMMINGINNGSGSAHMPLMAYMYNAITVGREDGNHASGDSGFDSAGRMIPQIVAPGDATSWAAAVVSAASALMIETIETTPELASNPDADRPEVIKSALLTGANHREGWSNNPATSGPQRGVTDRPLDPVLGVDLLDVNRSHLILTGGEYGSSPVPPDDCTIDFAGWSLTDVGLNSSVYYRISVPQDADKVSILSTWNRLVSPPFTQVFLANIDLRLWRVNEDGSLLDLVGDAGLPYFQGGNVVSESLLDNLEHLYVTGLAAGDYVLQVQRDDTLTGQPTWEVAVAWLFPEPPAGDPGDVNLDGVVDVLDLVDVILSWGSCACCPADLSGDGEVSVTDLIEVIVNWSS